MVGDPPANPARFLLPNPRRFSPCALEPCGWCAVESLRPSDILRPLDRPCILDGQHHDCLRFRIAERTRRGYIAEVQFHKIR